jgi:hypothetical protein
MFPAAALGAQLNHRLAAIGTIVSIAFHDVSVARPIWVCRQLLPLSVGRVLGGIGAHRAAIIDMSAPSPTALVRESRGRMAGTVKEYRSFRSGSLLSDCLRLPPALPRPAMLLPPVGRRSILVSPTSMR